SLAGRRRHPRPGGPAGRRGADHQRRRAGRLAARRAGHDAAAARRQLARAGRVVPEPAAGGPRAARPGAVRAGAARAGAGRAPAGPADRRLAARAAAPPAGGRAAGAAAMTAAIRTAPRILVGVDDSPAATAAVRWAAEFAGWTGGQVALLHVRPRLLAPGLLGRGSPAGTDPGAADRLLAGLASGLRDSAVDACAEVVDGDPARVLIARSARADLLVLGGGGRRRRPR